MTRLHVKEGSCSDPRQEVSKELSANKTNYATIETAYVVMGDRDRLFIHGVSNPAR